MLKVIRFTPGSAEKNMSMGLPKSHSKTSGDHVIS